MTPSTGSCSASSPNPQSTVVLVEPVREYFGRLEGAYSGLPGIRLENVAIADREGKRDFYRLGVDPELFGHPEWLSQLGSAEPACRALMVSTGYGLFDFDQDTLCVALG